MSGQSGDSDSDGGGEIVDPGPFCLCRGPDDGSLMISCDSCDEWYHAKCIGLKPSAARRIQNFICHVCRKIPMSELLRAHGVEEIRRGKHTSSSHSETDAPPQRAGKTVPPERLPPHLRPGNDESKHKSQTPKKRKRESDDSDDEGRKRQKSSDSSKPKPKKQNQDQERRKSLTGSNSSTSAPTAVDDKQKRAGPVNSLTSALSKDISLAAQCLALPEGSPELTEKLRELAQSIEEALYAASGNSISEYYQKQYKLVVLNLSNAKNPQIRRRVLLGELIPQRLVTMTEQEFLPADVLQQQKLKEEKMLEMKIKRDEGNKESILMNLVVDVPVGAAPVLLAEGNVSLSANYAPKKNTDSGAPSTPGEESRRLSLSTDAATPSSSNNAASGLRNSISSITKSPRASLDGSNDSFIRSATPPPTSGGGLNSSRDNTPVAPSAPAFNPLASIPSFDVLGSIQVDDLKPTETADLEGDSMNTDASRDQADSRFDDANDPFNIASLGRSSPTPKEPEREARIWTGTLMYPGQFQDGLGVRAAPCVPLDEDAAIPVHKFPLNMLPSILKITNRTDLGEMMKYLPQIDSSSSRRRTAFVLEPLTESDVYLYNNVFEHFKSVSRVGAILADDMVNELITSDPTKANLKPVAKDFFKEIYIVPISANSSVPAWLSKTDFDAEGKDKLVLVFLTKKGDPIPVPQPILPAGSLPSSWPAPSQSTPALASPFFPLSSPPGVAPTPSVGVAPAATVANVAAAPTLPGLGALGGDLSSLLANSSFQQLLANIPGANAPVGGAPAGMGGLSSLFGNLAGMPPQAPAQPGYGAPPPPQHAGYEDYDPFRSSSAPHDQRSPPRQHDDWRQDRGGHHGGGGHRDDWRDRHHPHQHHDRDRDYHGHGGGPHRRDDRRDDREFSGRGRRDRGGWGGRGGRGRGDYHH
eukprot:TRINITY_DN5800_c0_g1_i3.p1 TRINITY_DN5800_c0_g1~~TRINITY_DN5800_c0_g1_i3.p1  ORF type:complete len:926 (+),score=195.15 TRINITY_DN5800_c0_g1_i3:51-2828(+)